MKIFVINTDIIYYASRYRENIAFSKMLGDDMKKADIGQKASKIIAEFTSPTDKLHIYVKPRYMVKDYCEGKDIVYVGIFSTDDSILDNDYHVIEEFCQRKNIIPIFKNKPALGKIIKEILEGYTFRHMFPDKQLEMWEEYYEFNREVATLIKANSEMDDVLWIQDHNCFLVPDFVDRQKIITSFNLPFTSLAVSIPYYKQIMASLVKSKAISFFDSCSKLTFNEFSAPFTMNTGQPPITTVHAFSTDTDLLDKIVSSQEFQDCNLFNDVENLLVLPDNSPDHLLCIEAFLSKYEIPISVVLLNMGNIDLESQVEVQRLVAHLEITYRAIITSFLPRSDLELFKVISKSKIGFVTKLKGYFMYFNKQVITGTICDYEEIATKIYTLISGESNIDNSRIMGSKNIRKNLTTPTRIKDRMLSFVQPKTVIDANASTNSMTTIPDLDEKGHSIELKAIKDKLETSHLNNDSSILNRSRLIQVTTVDTSCVDMKEKEIDKLLDTIRNSEKVVLLLDYDGTLTPIVSKPEDATPSDRLIEMLKTINKKKNMELFIVSGRSQKDMDKFIPDEIDVFAEHGTFRRSKGEWSQLSEISNIELPYKIAQFYVERTPKSTLERKSNGFVFHYRNCDFDIGEKQAMSLYEQLKRVDPSSAKCGKKIVEFRNGEKKEVLNYIRGDLIIAAGDDVTDEDMFTKDVLSIKVGEGQSKAKYCVKDVNEMIDLLELISKNH